MKHTLKLLLLISLAIGDIACIRQEKTPRDTLVVALASAPATVDPRFATDAGGVRLASLLFSSLVRRDSQTLKMIGDAAESWNLKGRVYTFQLRSGIRFSDGTPLTKEDLDFTFSEYAKPQNPYKSTLAQISHVETQYDDKNRFVKLTLKEFNATFLSDLSSIRILPKHQVLKFQDQFGANPVGTGAYKYNSQSTNELRLEGNPFHFGRKPKVRYASFKIVRDDDTRFLKTYKGEIDILQSDLPFARVNTLEKKGEFRISKFPGLSMTYLLVNLKDPDLHRLAVRKAFAQAIERSEIIRYKLEGQGQPATSILTPINPYFHRDLKSLPYNRDQARKTFRELGLSGKRFVLKTSNLQTAIENGKVLAQQLSQAGLDVQLQSYEWGTFYGDIKKGNFQLATMKWVGSVDPDIYRTALHSKETPENSGRNRGRYANLGLDRLLEEGVKIDNEAARIQHYFRVQELVLEDLPIIPLWYENEVTIAHKRLKKYVPPLDGSFHTLIDVEKD